MDATQKPAVNIILDELRSGVSASYISKKHSLPLSAVIKIADTEGINYNELLEVNRYRLWLPAVVQSLAFLAINGRLPQKPLMKLFYKKTNEQKIVQVLKIETEILKNSTAVYEIILDYKAILRITDKVALKFGRAPRNFNFLIYHKTILETYYKCLQLLCDQHPPVNDFIRNKTSVQSHSPGESKISCIERLKKISEAAEQIPTPELLRQACIFDECILLFGSYSEALTAAGIATFAEIQQAIIFGNKLKSVKQHEEKTRQRKLKIIQDIKTLEQKSGKIPTKQDLLKASLYMKCYRLFGGYKKCLYEAGYADRKSRSREKLEKLKPFILMEFKSLYNELGKTPSKKDIQQRSAFGLKSYVKCFGSLKKLSALCEIPMTPLVNTRFTEQEMLNHLKYLYQKHGSRISGRIVKEEGLMHPQMFVRRFGNLGNAIRLAGIEYSVGPHPNRLPNLSVS